MEFDYMNFIILPLIIFLARIFDVSIGTIRIVFVSKGYKFLAPILGFFEVLSWILVVGKLMSGENIKLIHYIFYALGFAMGNFVGMYLENKILLGKILIRIIIGKNSKDFIKLLKEKNYNLTIFEGEGKKDKVKLIFLILQRKKLKELLDLIEKFDPNLFYTVEDIKYSNEKNPSNLERGKKIFSFNKKSK